MNVLPTELWMQVIQETPQKDWRTLLTTCRLLHSLLEAKLYEDVRIYRDVDEEEEIFPKVPQSTLFVQTLTARPKLFSLVRKLELLPSNEDDLLDPEMEPRDNYWNHPVLWQLPYFPHLRSLTLAGIHIDVDCYTALRSIPRLEELHLDHCDIDADLLDLQSFQGNTISTLLIDHPKSGKGWTALMTSGIHTLVMANPIDDLNMDQVLRGLLSCDLRRTLTKLKWTLEDQFHKELCQFIEPCVQLESLTITHRNYPPDDFAERTSHFGELSPGSMPMLSKFGGPAEYIAIIVAGRPVHNVSLQLWDDTPTDGLLALRRSKVPVTRLELWHGDHDYAPEDLPTETEPYLGHVPETIEILRLHETFHKEKLLSWIPALSKLLHLQTIKLESSKWSDNFTQIEVVRLLSEACPSLRKIILIVYNSSGVSSGYGKWVWRIGGSWEYYPMTWT